MSVGLDIDKADLDRLQKRLVGLSRERYDEVLEGVGAIIESQTRRRIQHEKTTPGGKPWQAWSPDYAASKHGASKNHEPHPEALYESQGHTLLSLDGGLLDSMHWQKIFDEVEIGSNMSYAKYQDDMRQFIGLSSSDTDEVLGIIDEFLDEKFDLK